MKKDILRLLFILTVLITSLCNKSNAQAKLGIFSVRFPDTVYTNTYYNVIINVQNKGDQIYSGPITNYYKYSSDTTTVNFVLDSLPMSFSGSNLSPGRTISYHSSIAFKTLNEGDNIVVVWPTGDNIVTSDSAHVHIFVKENASGIDNKNGNLGKIILFPNPIGDILSINSTLKIPIEQVRIMDIVGNEIFTSKEFKHGNFSINTSNYNQGVYFIEFIFEDRTRSIKKFVKAN